MSASRNKKNKAGGFRILWIPGRKKHGHKGRYDATNKQIQYSGGTLGHKNNAPWSLGGNKGLEKLIDSDIPGGSEGTSRVINALPTTYTIAATASTTVMKLDDTNQFSILDEREKQDEADFVRSNDINSAKYNNCDAPQSPDNSQEKNADKKDRNDREEKFEPPEKKENHHKKSKDNINSIESLQEKKLKDSAFDIADSSLYVNKYNGKKKNKKKKKKSKDGPDNDEDDPDENIVKCLYFTLMCCECTIS